jgi:hypothetical protein
MNATMITALPTVDHNGDSTLEAIYRVAATLRAKGVVFTMTPGCYGYWYGDDGELYENEAVVVEMSGNVAVMRDALGRYGEAAQQYEVLFVEKKDGWIAARGAGKDDAARLAKEYGGSTMFPGGMVISVAEYRALVHNRDYVSTVTGETV